MRVLNDGLVDEFGDLGREVLASQRMGDKHRRGSDEGFRLVNVGRGDSREELHESVSEASNTTVLSLMDTLTIVP